MKRITKIIFLILFLTPLCMKGQAVTWQKILDYTNNSILYKTQQTSDGGYIAVGTNRIGSYSKMMLVKFDGYGDTLWNKYFDLNENAVYAGFWIEETFDKGFIVTGSGPGANTDAYLIKTDSSGNVQWYKTFGGSASDQGLCVKQLSDNGFILLIRTFSYSLTSDILLIRTDQAGNEVWSKLYGNTTYHEIGRDIHIIENSGFIIVGWKQITNQPSSVYMIRSDINGDTLWTRTYNSYLRSTAYSVDVTNDKGFIIGGIADSTDKNYPLGYVIKTDSLGNEIWQKRYSSAFKEYCFSIRALSNNRFAFCGMSDSTFFNYERAILRVIDSDGNILDEKYYRGGLVENAFYSVDFTIDNGFILCGYSKYNLTKSFIVRTDSLGNIKPLNINNNFDLLNNYVLEQNYPNPFNSQTIIRYSLFKPAHIKFDIYDATGKFVSRLLNEFKSNGNYIFSFDPQKYNLASGIYFFNSTITLNSKIILKSNTLKMLYIK